jgi:hypothetical protein
MRSIETLMAEGQAKPSRSRAPRPCRVFDEEGREVFITKMCPHCREVKPLKKFGLRRMGDGTIRCAPWCKACRAKPAAAGGVS